MAKSLCDNCDYRQHVVARDTGTLFDRCSVMKMDLRRVDPVVSCSDYSARDAPYLFTKEAWILRKDKKGKLVFVEPSDGR
jgi:hypothetical protein